MRRVLGMLAVLPIMLSGCGSASAATRGYQVTNFAKLRVTGPFDVRVRTGVGSSVKAVGPQDKIERLSVEQNGDTLEIKPIRNSSWGDVLNLSKEPLIIYVGVPTLTAASLAGSGDVSIDRIKGAAFDLGLSGSGDIGVGMLDVQQLRLNATGSGDLTATGRADALTALLTGSGDVHGDKLMARTAQVKLVGSGDITIGATGTAAVTLAGSGDVTVNGGARCTVTRAGSGDVHCAGGGSTGE